MAKSGEVRRAMGLEFYVGKYQKIQMVKKIPFSSNVRKKPMNFNTLSPEKSDNAKSIKRITLPCLLTKDEYFMLSFILFHFLQNQHSVEKQEIFSKLILIEKVMSKIGMPIAICICNISLCRMFTRGALDKPCQK